MLEPNHADFVDIQKINPRIIVDVRYATTNNFTGVQLYGSARCFLRRAVAEKLDLIQKKLEEQQLKLKIYDGYRPHSVQKKMWDLVSDKRYVADPAVGSKHNRGAAVDVTLVDSSGCELLMPTPFDSFTVAAHRDYHDLPDEILKNRALLEEIMKAQGFIPLPTEWWHFDDADWASYPIVDVPVEAL